MTLRIVAGQAAEAGQCGLWQDRHPRGDRMYRQEIETILSMRHNNITLIGMPAAGKSMVGVLLAKRLGYSFIDTDIVIQEQEGRLLKEIIAQDGLDAFLAVENRVNASLTPDRAVIAPGGSVIYGREAMEHFKEIGTVIYLRVSYEALEKRLGDLKDRGVALRDGMTLRDLYGERTPLYEKYADITIDETGKSAGDIVDELREILAGWKR